jgi:putative oxidoreductase
MTTMDITVPTARTMRLTDLLTRNTERAVNVLERYLAPVLDLAIRIYVAAGFLQSGLTKIQSWDTTLALFEDEYHVPLLPPELAAYLGTAAELGLPVLLVAGLAGRFAALALFVFNIVAVISYPGLSSAGLLQHEMWGALLLVTLVHGAGKLSIDHLLRRRFLGAR